MSHFSVLVIGDDVEGQLAPYDENIKTEPKPEAFSQESVDSMAKHYGTTDLAELATKMQDWDGVDGKVILGVLHRLSVYNPKSQWDWYQIGGRWAGLIHATNGSGSRGEPSMLDKDDPYSFGGVDQCRVSDLDLEKTQEMARARAKERWDKIQDGTDLAWGDECDCTEAEYIDRRASVPFPTFAVVKDGEWFERGKRGWFGCVRDEKDSSVWGDEYAKLIDGLPGDTFITLVDCHI